MENIINSIKSMINPIMETHGFLCEGNIYKKIIDKEQNLYCTYEFQLRKKIGGDYYFLSIRLHINQKEISDIANSANIECVQDNNKLSVSQKRKEIRELKKNETIASLIRWSDIDNLFRTDVTIWNCSLYSFNELYNFEKQFMILFEKGQEWVDNALNWDFLIKWNENTHFYDRALSILKYLGRKEEFDLLKGRAMELCKSKPQYLNLLQKFNI